MKHRFDKFLSLPPPPAPFRHKDSRPAGREWPAGFRSGFTLVELLIAIGIFSIVVTLVSSLYIQSFRETARANLHNQIYEDARFIMTRIADEVRNGMIDYDEYYNQHVVIPTLAAGGSIPGSGLQNFGQNYGRYYSAFFHPGNDRALGFDCNDGGARNRRECTPLRRTIDRNTGANPFSGKFTGSSGENENAFCGNVSYGDPTGARPASQGRCDTLSGEPLPGAARTQSELYLISPDGFQKTILAREKIGAADDAYALSILRLKGVDTDQDGLADHFVCSNEFQCRGGNDFDVTPNDNAELNLETNDGACGAGDGVLIAADLPRSRASELEAFNASNPEGDICDIASSGFAKDFVPVSPFRVKITQLNFYISPAENPHYAFAEADEHLQPIVTIVMKVEPNISGMVARENFRPLILTKTVMSRPLHPVPAPLLTQ